MVDATSIPLELLGNGHTVVPDPVAPDRLMLCSCDNYSTSRDVLAHDTHLASVILQDIRSRDKVVDEVNMSWPEYEHTPIWNDMQQEKGAVYWANFTDPRGRKKAKKPTSDELADILANIGEDADA